MGITNILWRIGVDRGWSLEGGRKGGRSWSGWAKNKSFCIHPPAQNRSVLKSANGSLSRSQRSPSLPSSAFLMDSPSGSRLRLGAPVCLGRHRVTVGKDRISRLQTKALDVAVVPVMRERDEDSGRDTMDGRSSMSPWITGPGQEVILQIRQTTFFYR